MPVETEHPDYKLFENKWLDCRTAIAGGREVKEGGEKYLPRNDGQTQEQYDAFKMRAVWSGATAVTVSASLGALFQKPPVLEPEEGVFDELIQGETDFPTFLKQVSREVLSVGRVGVMADVDLEGEVFITMYKAEDIINWGDPEYVVLRERFLEVSEDDEFEHTESTQYRVLKMVNGAYQQTIFKGKEGEELVEEVITPGQNGLKLEAIPFVIINTNSIGTSIQDPPFLPLIDVNFSQYRSSADLEHGRHWTALPTPWLAGFKIKDKDLAIGSGNAWQADDPAAKVGMLEFTGQGLDALVTAIIEKQAQMAVLGVRFLEPSVKGVEAAETLKLKNLGQDSVLSSVASTIDQGMEQIIKIAATWAKKDSEKISIELNKDYSDVQVDAQLFNSLYISLLGRQVSYETWYYNLNKWGMYPSGSTQEKEQALIKTNSGMDDL